VAASVRDRESAAEWSAQGAVGYKVQLGTDFHPVDIGLEADTAALAIAEEHSGDHPLPNSDTEVDADIVARAVECSDWDTARAADFAVPGCLADVDSRGCWDLSFQGSYTLLFLTVVGPSHGN
jgi:hypothetical protein